MALWWICLFSTLAEYEMSTLPKHSGTSEGSKFSSMVHSEPEPEMSKVPLDEGKAREIVSSADDSPESFKATKSKISMKGPHYPEKGMDMWDLLQLENMYT